MENTVVWFDIPVKDMERAKQFYANVFDVQLNDMDNGPNKMAFFPYAPGVASGCLVQSEQQPSNNGVTIYINGGNDLSDKLSKVENAGGQVLTEKMEIGEAGFISYFQDTEGNKVGIHSMN